MIVKTPRFAWGGLNTRADATGLPLLECVTLQDLRVVGKDLVQRLGLVRVGQVGGTAKALDFTAASSESCEAPVDTRVWALGLYWTLEIVIELDTTAGTQGILTVGHTTPAMILDVTGGNIRFRIWDSGATLDTITVGTATTSVQSIQITRNAATLSARLDNGTATTETMSATLNVRTPVGDIRLARDDGANYMDGTIDGPRLLSIVKSNHNDRLVRLPNPRARYVLADYDGVISNTLMYDRSRYENHLVALNTPTEATSLCHNPAPVRALSLGVDENNKRQLLVAAGGNYFLATVE